MPTAGLEGALREALAPAYQLVKPLGVGGMGSVFLAREPALKRSVARLHADRLSPVACSALIALGTTPRIDRLFTEQEAETGDALALLSDGAWRSRNGADPASWAAA